MSKLTVAQKTANAKYDASNTQFIGLKLNKNTDTDILAALEGKQKQTEIKRLVRIGLACELATEKETRP